MLPVLFRKFPNGEIIALFPTLPGIANSRSMVAYTKSAKRTEAEPSIMYVTVEATAEEREAVAMEVSRAFPHDELDIRHRINASLNEQRSRNRGTDNSVAAAHAA